MTASRMCVYGFAMACCLSSAPALAQTSIESNAGIQFDFLSPGARSMGVGSAFVGLADDATAAFTNPAGLRTISRMELSAEVRGWWFVTPFTSGGRLSGTPTLLGVDQAADLTFSDSRKSTGGLSFVSFVYPSAKWSVAVYGQRLADFSYSAESQGPFALLPRGDLRLNPYRASLSTTINRYGVSGSLKLGDKASLGAGVYLYDFSLNSDTARFAVNPNRPQLYSAATFSSPVVRSDVQTGDDRRVGFTVGLTATPHSRLQVGAVYRQGAELELTIADVVEGQTSTSTGTFTVPDVFAAGVSFRLAESLRLNIDYDRVRYSQMAENFTYFAATPGALPILPGDYKVEDANEMHFGAVYVFLKLALPLTVRGGAWFDPDHAIRFAPAVLQNADPYALAVFREGEDVIHGAGGVGVVIRSVEINGAVDISTRTKTMSVSTVVRF